MYTSTSYRLFLRYLFIVVIPIVILLVVGTVSIVINQGYVSRQIVDSNRKALEQIRNNFDLTFDELDSLALSFSVSPDFLFSLNQIVTSKQLTFEQSKVLSTIKNFVGVSAYSRPYVQSIYAYIQNKGDKVLTTSDGIVDLESFYDRSWYRSFLAHPHSDLQWTERRNIDRYPGVDTPQPVLSIFRRVYSLTGVRVPGVIVLNIDVAYLKGVMAGLKTSPDERLLVFDAHGNTLLSNYPAASKVWQRLAPLHFATPSTERVRIGGKQYVELALGSHHYGWVYVTLTPVSTFYRASASLRQLNVAIVLLSFLLGCIIVYYTSRRNFRHIESVVDIVEAAEQGEPLPPAPSRMDKSFSHITYAILRTFVEHKYMTVQLSERRYRQRTLELLALHSQMNPHFLFNTLETINWRTIQLTHGPSEINDIIEKLSNVLKYSLESPFTLETLSNEIKHAKDYLAIQEIRYKNRFTVTWRCNPNLDRYKIIRFLLQPLLENAIYHGIKETTGTHAIEIRISKTGSTIRIEIADDGKGMSEERLEEIRTILRSNDDHTENIGLYNTNKRVKLAFGEQYGLSIDSTAGSGTTVTVVIPATT